MPEVHEASESGKGQAEVFAQDKSTSRRGRVCDGGVHRAGRWRFGRGLEMAPAHAAGGTCA